MAITGMNHVNVLTNDVPATVAFYCNALGLQEGQRPELGFPGAWLYADGTAIVHISGGRRREQLNAGVIDHIAFSAKDLRATLERLRLAGIDAAARQQVGTGIWQVFVTDPNGARVELDFDAGEIAPDA